MNVPVLDDRSGTLRFLPCLELLEGHDVTVWTDHETEVAARSAGVLPRDAQVFIRE